MNNDLGDIQSRKVENHEEIDDIFDEVKVSVKMNYEKVYSWCNC